MTAVTLERVAALVDAGDEASILALEAATEPRPLGAEALFAEATRADAVFLVARAVSTTGADGALRADCAVVGFASARLLIDEAHVFRISVATPWRRQGIGARLLDGLVAWAREVGAHAVVLEVRESNAAALALYAREGFVADGRRTNYYADGEAALLLRRPLSASTVADEGRG